jgi:hypothetical protein
MPTPFVNFEAGVTALSENQHELTSTVREHGSRFDSLETPRGF